MTLDRILDALKAQEGLLSTLGIELQITDDGVLAHMTVTPQHCGAPGIAHGGSIAALLDSALGFEALRLALDAGGLTSTVELKTNFLRPVPVGQRLVVRPEVQSRGKSLLVLSGAAEDVETGKRVAFAVGTFNVFASEHARGQA
jgi:uncharacterized protein (TIGR00369 family)